MNVERSGRVSVLGALVVGACVTIAASWPALASGEPVARRGSGASQAVSPEVSPEVSPSAVRLSGVRAVAGVTTIDVVVPLSASGRTLGTDAFDVRLDGVPFGASVRRLTDMPLSVDLVLEVPTDPTAVARLQGAAAEFVIGLPRAVAVRVVTGGTITDFSLDRGAALDALRHLTTAAPVGDDPTDPTSPTRAAIADAVVTAARPTESELEGSRRLTVVVAQTDPTAAVLGAVAVGDLDASVTWLIRTNLPAAPSATLAQPIASGDAPPDRLTPLSTSADLLGAFDRVAGSVAGTYSISVPGAVGGSSVEITLSAVGRTSMVTTSVPADGAAPRPPGPSEILPPVARAASPDAVPAGGVPARASRGLITMALLMVMGAGLLLGRFRRTRPPVTPVEAVSPTAAQLRLREAAARARRALHELGALRTALDHPMPADVVLVVEAVASARIDDPRVTGDDLVGLLDHAAAVPAPIAASHAHALRALAVPGSPAAWDRAMRQALEFDSGRSDCDVPAGRSSVRRESLLDAVMAIAEQERVRSRDHEVGPGHRTPLHGSGAVGRSLLACWPVRAGILDVPLLISPSLVSLTVPTSAHHEPTSDRPDDERSMALLVAVAHAARRMGDVERIHDALSPTQRSSPRDVADAVLAVLAVDPGPDSGLADAGVDLRTVHRPDHVPT